MSKIFANKRELKFIHSLENNLPNIDEILQDKEIINSLQLNVNKINSFFIDKITKSIRRIDLKVFEIILKTFIKYYVNYLNNKKSKLEKIKKISIKGYSGSLEDTNNIFISSFVLYIVFFSQTSTQNFQKIFINLSNSNNTKIFYT
jgi:hypothetical protein